MMIRVIALVLFVSCAQVASAQNPYGIKLNPGETLVSVNGVVVNQQAYAAAQSAKAQQAPAPQKTTVNKPVIAENTAGTAKAIAATSATPAKSVPVALSMYSGSDQDRAQAEANYMAQNGITGHVGATIGNFEGCGWSSGGMPPTCTPGYSMALTADAIAHGPRGVYRVRAWR